MNKYQQLKQRAEKNNNGTIEIINDHYCKVMFYEDLDKISRLVIDGVSEETFLKIVKVLEETTK